MSRAILYTAVLWWVVASGWCQSPVLVVAAFSGQQTETVSSLVDRLKPFLDDRNALQREAAEAGYTVVWEGDTAMLFPKLLTTESRAQRALQFLETLHNELQRMEYRPGQPIAGDALSKSALDALASLLGVESDSALMHELRTGARAIALDVVINPRQRNGSPVVFKATGVPCLSRLELNAAAVVRASDQLRERWLRMFPNPEPQPQQGNSPEERRLSQLMQQALLDVGRASEMRFYFSHSLELEAVEQYTLRYLKRLNQLRQEALRRLRAAEFEMARLLLHEMADAFPQNFERPAPLTAFPPALQQLILEGLAEPMAADAIVLSPEDFVLQLSLIQPTPIPTLEGKTQMLLNTLTGISLYPPSRPVYVKRQ